MPTNPLSRDLRRLLAAQLPADFADWLDFVAIGALLAYVWQAEPFVFALLAVSMGAPYLLIGPFAGVLVDRMAIRQLLILSNLGRAVTTAALFLAPDWPVLLALVFCRSAVDTFYTPAKQAAIQALTEPDQRNRANGFSHAINQSSKIVAPALGGVFLIWLAPQMVFLINALVSLLAAAMILRLPAIGVTMAAPDENILHSIRDGMQTVRGKPVLRAALLMMAAGYFAMFFYDTLIAPLTRDLGFSQTVLGLSLAAVGAGGVAGALVLGTTKRALRPFFWIAGGFAIGASMTVILGMSEVTSTPLHVILYIALFGILGIASAMSVVPVRTIIQDAVSPDQIGRITALSEAINTFALLTAPFIGAAIAATFSIGAAFIAGGLVMCGAAIRALTLRDQG